MSSWSRTEPTLLPNLLVRQQPPSSTRDDNLFYSRGVAPSACLLCAHAVLCQGVSSLATVSAGPAVSVSSSRPGSLRGQAGAGLSPGARLLTACPARWASSGPFPSQVTHTLTLLGPVASTPRASLRSTLFSLLRLRVRPRLQQPARSRCDEPAAGSGSDPVSLLRPPAPRPPCSLGPSPSLESFFGVSPPSHSGSSCPLPTAPGTF